MPRPDSNYNLKRNPSSDSNSACRSRILHLFYCVPVMMLAAHVDVRTMKTLASSGKRANSWRHTLTNNCWADLHRIATCIVEVP